MRCMLALLFVVGCTLTTQAQKVKIKDDIATVDGTDYLKWKKQSAGNEASIYLLDSEDEVIFVRYLNYSDPSRVSKSNPEGKVRWIEINFLTLNLKCEVDSRTHKGLVKLFYDNGLIENNALNQEKIEKFVSKYGTIYSENRPGSVIIISN